MTRLSEMMTTKQAGDIMKFRTGYRYIVHLIHAGQLQAHRIGGRYLITPEALEDYRRMRTGKIVKRSRNVTLRKERDQRRKERKQRRENEKDNQI